jgi:hypothetical protein
LSVEKHGITVILVHVFTDAIANGGSDSFSHNIPEKIDNIVKIANFLG